MSKEAIGCCGAYCAKCKALVEAFCRGCKLGYKNGERDLLKVKCKIKICCMKTEYISCADCGRYYSCEMIQNLHNHKGYKYGKYKQAILFIREHGYGRFLSIADKWKMQYGKYN